MSQFLLATAILQDTTLDAGLPMFTIVLIAALSLLVVVSNWIVYEKADEPGWASLVPIYSGIVFARIGDESWWWGLLLMVPFINIVVWVFLCVQVAQRFGRGTGFGLGLAMLPWVFMPILAFSDAAPRVSQSPAYKFRA